MGKRCGFGILLMIVILGGAPEAVMSDSSIVFARTWVGRCLHDPTKKEIWQASCRITEEATWPTGGWDVMRDLSVSILVSANPCDEARRAMIQVGWGVRFVNTGSGLTPFGAPYYEYIMPGAGTGYDLININEEEEGIPYLGEIESRNYHIKRTIQFGNTSTWELYMGDVYIEGGVQHLADQPMLNVTCQSEASPNNQNILMLGSCHDPVEFAQTKIARGTTGGLVEVSWIDFSAEEFRDYDLGGSCHIETTSGGFQVWDTRYECEGAIGGGGSR